MQWRLTLRYVNRTLQQLQPLQAAYLSTLQLQHLELLESLLIWRRRSSERSDLARSYLMQMPSA